MILATSAATLIGIAAIIAAASLVPIVGAWRGTRGTDDELREVLDGNAKAQERVADELVQLTTKVTELERLLKEVG
jgi:hypothetical protein